MASLLCTFMIVSCTGMDLQKPQYRKIIHLDMDAFYASVEQRDFPQYRDRPIVVGGSPEGRGGVVATASYEARRFGIRSAMPSKTARRLCPEAIFVFPRFDIYKSVSQEVRAIFRRYTDLIEPLSLDEAYLDVTTDKMSIGSALGVARAIRQAIREELQLTASAGVSINKFVAKVASDLHKPDGLTFIGPSQVEAFMEQLPVEKFYGVGRVTAARMHRMGLHTGADLKQLSEAELVSGFGKTGRFYYRIVRGIDDRPVQPYRETKSVSVEDTFPADLTREADMLAELEKLAGRLSLRLQKAQLCGRTVTMKVKLSDFTIITRNYSFPEPVCGVELIMTSVRQLISRTPLEGRKVRLLGLGISHFGAAEKAAGEKSYQLTLF